MLFTYKDINVTFYRIMTIHLYIIDRQTDRCMHVHRDMYSAYYVIICLKIKAWSYIPMTLHELIFSRTKGIKKRMIKFSLEGTSRGHLVQDPDQSKATVIRLHRTVSSQGSIMSRISHPLQVISWNIWLPSVETLSHMGTSEGEITNNSASR